jgi:hypothetical protein
MAAICRGEQTSISAYISTYQAQRRQIDM